MQQLRTHETLKGHIHTLYSFVFLNTAKRDLLQQTPEFAELSGLPIQLTLDETNIGQIALQLNDGSYWLLLGFEQDGPTTLPLWERVVTTPDFGTKYTRDWDTATENGWYLDNSLTLNRPGSQLGSYFGQTVNVRTHRITGNEQIRQIAYHFTGGQYGFGRTKLFARRTYSDPQTLEQLFSPWTEGNDVLSRTYASSAQRISAALTLDDIGSIVKEADTGKFYIVSDVIEDAIGPGINDVVWYELGGGPMTLPLRVSNAVELKALTLSSADVGRLVFQSDINEYFLVVDRGQVLADWEQLTNITTLPDDLTRSTATQSSLNAYLGMKVYSQDTAELHEVIGISGEILTWQLAPIESYANQVERLLTVASVPVAVQLSDNTFWTSSAAQYVASYPIHNLPDYPIQVLNAVERESLYLTQRDVGKLVQQTDNNSFWAVAQIPLTLQGLNWELRPHLQVYATEVERTAASIESLSGVTNVYVSATQQSFDVSTANNVITWTPLTTSVHATIVERDGVVYTLSDDGRAAFIAGTGELYVLSTSDVGTLPLSKEKLVLDHDVANDSVSASFMGNFINHTSLAADTLTIPPDSVLEVPVGSTFELHNIGNSLIFLAGGVINEVTLVSDKGYTIPNGATLGGTVTVTKIAANTWLLDGDLVGSNVYIKSTIRFATAAERTAEVDLNAVNNILTVDKIGSIAYQVDSKQFWMLQALEPNTVTGLHTPLWSVLSQINTLSYTNATERNAVIDVGQGDYLPNPGVLAVDLDTNAIHVLQSVALVQNTTDVYQPNWYNLTASIQAQLNYTSTAARTANITAVAEDLPVLGSIAKQIEGGTVSYWSLRALTETSTGSGIWTPSWVEIGSPGGVQYPIVVADATARNALTLTSNDVGNFVYQKDTRELYTVLDNSVPMQTWTQLPSVSFVFLTEVDLLAIGANAIGATVGMTAWAIDTPDTLYTIAAVDGNANTITWTPSTITVYANSAQRLLDVSAVSRAVQQSDNTFWSSTLHQYFLHNLTQQRQVNVANAAQRNAMFLTLADIGTIVYQEDNHSYWVVENFPNTQVARSSRKVVQPHTVIVADEAARLALTTELDTANYVYVTADELAYSVNAGNMTAVTTVVVADLTLLADFQVTPSNVDTFVFVTGSQELYDLQMTTVGTRLLSDKPRYDHSTMNDTVKLDMANTFVNHFSFGADTITFPPDLEVEIGTTIEFFTINDSLEFLPGAGVTFITELGTITKFWEYGQSALVKATLVQTNVWSLEGHLTGKAWPMKAVRRYTSFVDLHADIDSLTTPLPKLGDIALVEDLNNTGGYYWFSLRQLVDLLGNATIYKPYWLEIGSPTTTLPVADHAARIAVPFLPSDAGRLVYQSDIDKYFIVDDKGTSHIDWELLTLGQPILIVLNTFADQSLYQYTINDVGLLAVTLDNNEVYEITSFDTQLAVADWTLQGTVGQYADSASRLAISNPPPLIVHEQSSDTYWRGTFVPAVSAELPMKTVEYEYWGIRAVLGDLQNLTNQINVSGLKFFTHDGTDVTGELMILNDQAPNYMKYSDEFGLTLVSSITTAPFDVKVRSRMYGAEDIGRIDIYSSYGDYYNVAYWEFIRGKTSNSATWETVKEFRRPSGNDTQGMWLSQHLTSGITPQFYFYTRAEMNAFDASDVELGALCTVSGESVYARLLGAVGSAWYPIEKPVLQFGDEVDRVAFSINGRDVGRLAQQADASMWLLVNDDILWNPISLSSDWAPVNLQYPAWIKMSGVQEALINSVNTALLMIGVRHLRTPLRQVLNINSFNGSTLRVLSDSSLMLPIGSICEFVNIGTSCTIAPENGSVTILAASLAVAQYETVKLVKIAANTWLVQR